MDSVKKKETVLRNWVDRIGLLASSWDNRPDFEHQQALLRLCVGFLVLVYLVYTVFHDGIFSISDKYTLFTASLFFVSGFTILVWLFKDPGVNVVRRLLGIFTDCGATTAVLYFNGILAAPLFVLYLWVTFGNGFRYGQKYLALSAILGVLGYGTVVFGSSHQEISAYVQIGLLVGLIVLPLYVSGLLRQLNRTLELAESANRAKSNFLATMSHEIRTPLNGMVGITEMLGQTELDSQQHHYVELISQSSEWLMRVITDGLDFSKIEAGEFLLIEDNFNLPRALEELCSFYKGTMKGKEVKFVCDISPTLPEVVRGDQLRLIQVLGNLISNSLKFTSNGQVSLTVTEGRQGDDMLSVEFAVADTGIGISPEKQGVIFEPFRQEGAETVKKYGGTGLGLAIADRIVTLVGGKLVLESRVGRGSEFSFTIPFMVSTLAPEGVIGNNDKDKVVKWRKLPRILLAEDQEINREVVVSQLEHIGCLVTVAKDGNEAVRLFRDQVFDMVLMDCQMPELDGYGATVNIRLLESEQEGDKATPIVALTAHVTVDDKKKCLACGMDDYLGKPFRNRELRSLLYKWLDYLVVTRDREEFEIETLATKAHKKPAAAAGGDRKLFHDLNNALSVIQGSAELAIIHPAQLEDHRKNFERIQKASIKATHIIEQLASGYKETQ